ncbi:MAG: GNAT family N-acetyltransferase [Bacilli bacterium]|nr:GNAT family N-acetyltransferase [Bacilli bacterium]MBR3049116.1 GNAT family N-acetyltransferase [Bacilli bacterium]
MIKELTKDNINIINNSFIDKENVLKELSNNPFSKYLIYLEKTQVIGYLYYSDIYDRVEINQIEINSIHRNCGYGSKLLEYLINSVNKNITLEVNKENIYAIKLYKKYNFKEVAIRKGYYNGIDGILMERLFK